MYMHMLALNHSLNHLLVRNAQCMTGRAEQVCHSARMLSRVYRPDHVSWQREAAAEPLCSL